MRPGQTIYLGDGLYLHYDGYGLELRANSHDQPTDRCYLEPQVIANFIDAVEAIKNAHTGVHAA